MLAAFGSSLKIWPTGLKALVPHLTQAPDRHSEVMAALWEHSASSAAAPLEKTLP